MFTGVAVKKAGARRIRVFAGAQDGASAAEFALLVPVYILLVMGGIAYGVYFGAAHSVQQLAADAARTAVAGLNAGERQALVSDYVAANAGAYTLLDAGGVSFSAGANPADPNQFLVTISYDAADLPIWNLSLPLPAPDRIIRHSSTIRNGGS
jgi:Flp pilus assembly protein TadG